MPVFEGNILWVGGFLLLTSLCILAIFLRNHAAKTDRVHHTEQDTIKNSVSLKPKKNSPKFK